MGGPVVCPDLISFVAALPRVDLTVAVRAADDFRGHIEVLAEAAHAAIDLGMRLAELIRGPGANLYHRRGI